MTRLVVISDTHNQHNKVDLPEGDILIHCDDMTGRGSLDEIYTFAQWLGSIQTKFKHILITPGNHDFGFQTNLEKSMWQFKEVLNLYVLIDRGIELLGIKFYGTPWVPQFYNWAFMTNEAELTKKFSNIDEDCQVLISHGPPRTVLDKNINGEFCGSSALFQRVKQLKNLKLHVFGHIHEGAGIENIDNVIFANCSQVDEGYRLVHKPLVFDL